MLLRTPRPWLLLPLALLVAGLAQPSPPSYLRFVREHVDFPRTLWGYCDHMMQQLNKEIGICKLAHTFLHASASRLPPVCTPWGGTCHAHECDSRAAFLLTTCRLRSHPRPPRCLYTGIPQSRRIRVHCKGGLPVRLVQVL